MQVAFPHNVRIKSLRPRLEGLRHEPFVNIDGETFARPSLNGYWRVSTTLICGTEDEFLALSFFLTAMRGVGRTVLPMHSLWLPNNQRGRKLAGFSQVGEFAMDHAGFAAAPYGGFTLRSAVAHRDSYIDVNKPALSNLRPGHFITLDDQLYQVVRASAIGESETAVRVSVMPNIRGAHAVGKVVIVDHLRLGCMMESADEPETWQIPFSEVAATFIEAF